MRAAVRAWLRTCVRGCVRALAPLLFLLFLFRMSTLHPSDFSNTYSFELFDDSSIRHVRCYDTPTCQYRNISTSKHLNFAAFQHLNTSTLNFQHSNWSQLSNPLNFQHFNCSASQPFQHKVQLFNFSASRRVHTLISPCAKWSIVQHFNTYAQLVSISTFQLSLRNITFQLINDSTLQNFNSPTIPIQYNYFSISTFNFNFQRCRVGVWTHSSEDPENEEGPRGRVGGPRRPS